MAKSIVFLMSVPFSDHYARRFGIHLLESKGINVHIIDLSGLLNAKFLSHSFSKNSTNDSGVYQISSYPELEQKIKALSATGIFVDYLVGLSGINLKYERVFRILKMYDARYCIISDADISVFSFGKAGINRNFFKKYFRMFNIRFFCDQITKHALKVLIKHSKLYPLPVRVFGIESDSLRKYMNRYADGKIPYTRINSSDYSIYLNYIRHHQEIRNDREKTCVFLDEAAIHSYDFDILGMKNLDGNGYLKVMNQFFDRIENVTGLKVIIAAHPASRYEQNDFEGRKIIKGDTVDLVAQSNLVIAHYTTAVSFAVLFNKPTLIVKTNDMVKIKRDVYCDRMAEELGLVSMNIEDPKQLASLSDKIDSSLKNNFNAYKYQYLASQGLEDLTTWDIVAEELQKI